HPYRVDVRRVSDARGSRRGQRLIMSVYAPATVPGHDSPMHRVSGLVRPGRIDLGPFDEAAPV
ncbi:MAG: hypothetical protein ACRDGD_03505, partial [Candidatus Limnocylindria bacterium]